MSLTASSPSSHKIRRLDPHRDLDAVADLIETSFELKNDPDGQIIIRQMRALAQRQRYIPSTLLLPGTPDGFVWEEDGQIVGNISLIPFFSNFKRIFMIANVAVAPAYRLQGIATTLTQQALHFLRQTQTPESEVWLQVRKDNFGAIQMYEKLGFRFINSLTQWKHAPVNKPYSQPLIDFPKTSVITSRRPSDWQFQRSWLEANYPKQTRWYLSVDFQSFSPWAWLNPVRWDKLSDLSHLALHEKDQLTGVLTWQKTDLSSDQLWLATSDTPTEDQQVKQLIGFFLLSEKPSRALALEFPYGRAVSGLLEVGFIVARHLDWMKYFPTSG